MKKSDFVAAVLKESCSLVNEDQVLQNLEIFMKLGMMNELTMLTMFLASTGVQHTMFTDKQFIDEESVNAGAVISVSIRDSAHLNFDINGKLVGSSTDSAKSYKKRKNK